MKFKFCGDNDCQDWILAQIIVFSKLTSIKLKLILKEVINHILDGKLNFDNVCKLTSDAKLSQEETKAVLASLNYIILSSVKYNTDSETVSNELQQLGLPREHSIALSKAYSENFHKIKQLLKVKSVKFNNLEEYSYDIVSHFEDENCSVSYPSLLLTTKIQNPSQTISKTFHVMPEKLNCLINDLQEILQLMESIES